jgi:hypothetical protein
MSLRPHFLFMAFLACAPAVHAVRPVATPAPKSETPAKAEAPKPTEPLPPYELKNRSSFTSAVDIARAPFWPIGWMKRGRNAVATAAVQEAPKVSLDAKSFKVTSILLGSGSTASLAVINGRAYSEGEFLRLPKTASTTPPPRIRVQRITDGNVVLVSGDQTLVANLARPELSSPKPEQLLDDKDR